MNVSEASGFLIKWRDDIQHFVQMSRATYCDGPCCINISVIRYIEHILHFYIGRNVVFIGPGVGL